MSDDKTFQISVSRMAKGKEGYKSNRYEFGNSFYPETVTDKELFHIQTVEGFPVTGLHKREKPGEIAAARGVKTYRHSENFVSTAVLELDDDGHIKRAEKFWLNDPFFMDYGSFLYHTPSSTPEQERVRPAFIFDDHVITSTGEYTEAMRAITLFYSYKVDELTDAVRVFYGNEGAKATWVGNRLPYAVFEADVLTPYRQFKEDEARALDLERARRVDSIRNKQVPLTGRAMEAFAIGRINWVVDFCAKLGKGSNRNRYLYWAGRTFAGANDTMWMSSYMHHVMSAKARVVDAFHANNYAKDYGADDKEIERIFDAGYAAGGQSWEEPQLESWFAFEVGDTVTVAIEGKQSFTAVVTARKRPRGNNGSSFSAYYVGGKTTLYPEWAMTLSEADELDTVTPALTEEQKVQVRAIITSKLLSYQAAMSGKSSSCTPFPQGISEMYGLGYSVDMETGEVDKGVAVPFPSVSIVKNIEYRRAGEYSYEYGGRVPLFDPNTMGVCDSGNILIIPDALEAISAYLMLGQQYAVYGLPQAQLGHDYQSRLEGNIYFATWRGAPDIDITRIRPFLRLKRAKWLVLPSRPSLSNADMLSAKIRQARPIT